MQARLFYTQFDWGTERALHLVDENGKDLVPPRDPFHATGAPIDTARRKARVKAVGREMLQEYMRSLELKPRQA